MGQVPDYGRYSPYENAFGARFLHGWMTGVEVSNQQAMEQYPEFTSADLENYQNGRQDGVQHDYSRLKPWLMRLHQMGRFRRARMPILKL
jgi:hypothetical protein